MKEELVAVAAAEVRLAKACDGALDGLEQSCMWERLPIPQYSLPTS